MADINTTILIQAKDEASGSIQKIAQATKEIGNGAKDSINGVNALGAAVKSALLPLVSIGVAINGLRQSITMASDLQEANSKAMTVFRNNTLELKTAIQELTSSYGLSTIEATKALGQLGDLFKPLGFAEKDALALSQTTVKLAKDLASFNNLKTDDVLRDIQSALVGNTESVRKYGVVLNEATIQQAAINAGLNPKNLTPAQKSWLILQEIIKSNSDALGDYQRTQNSFANSLRRLATFITEVGTAFGSTLLNALNPLIDSLANIATQALPYVLQGFQKFGNALNFVTDLIKALLQTFNLLATFIVRSFGDIIIKALTPLIKVIGKILQSVADFYNKLTQLAQSVGITMPKITFQFTQATDEILEGMDKVIQKTKEGKTLFEALGLSATKATTSIAKNLPNLTVAVPTSTGNQTAQTSTATAVAVANTDPFLATLMAFVNSFTNALTQASVAFKYLYNITETIANVLASRLGSVIDRILMPLIKLLDQFILIIAEIFGNLLNALAPLLQTLFSNVLQTLAIFVLQLVQLLQLVIPVVQFLAQLLAPFMKAVSFILDLIYTILAGIYNNIFVPIINIFIKAFNAIGGFFSGALNWVIDVINGVINAINRVLGWLRWGKIGTIGRIDWQNISEVSPVLVPSGSFIGGTSEFSASSYGGGGGLSVQQARPITVNFTNNGVLTGFKDEEEFISWIRTGLRLASERGL